MNFEAYTFLSQQTFLGNPVSEYLIGILLFLVYLLIFKIVQGLLIFQLKRFAKKTATDIDDTLIRVVDSLQPPFYSFVAFYLALNYLTLDDYVQRFFDIVLIAWVTYQVIHAVEILIDYVTRRALKDRDEGDAESAIQALSLVSKIILWFIGILLILSNVGVDITSLIAGLGIGGIAVAFAVKDLLSDLFSSFTIYFDKPFKVGDFIVVGSTAGTVKQIGLKTTRIKSLQGEEVVIPNQQLTAETVQNYKRMERRRIEFSLGVTYDTGIKKVEKIPQMIQEVIEATDNVEFGRTHFRRFGDSALEFEIVYHVTSGDYQLFMDSQHAINLGIMRAFDKAGIDFAYPTQTIYTKKI